jgi:hypothetical protein
VAFIAFSPFGAGGPADRGTRETLPESADRWHRLGNEEVRMMNVECSAIHHSSFFIHHFRYPVSVPGD